MLNRLRAKVGSALIKPLARISGINLLKHAHTSMGMMNTAFNENGEAKLLELLSDHISSDESLLDIGANIGEYSLALKEQFPNHEIHAFEPNPVACAKLAEIPGIKIHQVGLGDQRSQMTLYTPGSQQSNAHSSLVPEALVKGPLHEEIVEVHRLDEYYPQQSEKKVAFIKIDVEGYEITVLQGLGDLLNSVKAIQFEFNYHLLYTGHGLKDFYALLPEFQFFRLQKEGPVALGEYDPINEVYQMHNLAAVRPEFARKIGLID